MCRLLLAAALAVATSSAMHAQSSGLDVNTRQLSGIRTVLVQITPDLANIDTTTIRNVVESELRRVGLTVLDRAIPGLDAIVAVNVHFNPPQTAMTCFIQVNQDAHLDRSTRTPAVARWFSRLFIAQVNPSNINRLTQEAFRDLVPDLTNAYLAANPR